MPSQEKAVKIEVFNEVDDDSGTGSSATEVEGQTTEGVGGTAQVEQVGAESSGTPTSTEAPGSADAITVSIEGESPPPNEEAAAPEWVRDLRKKYRETQKRNQELEEQLKQVAPKTPELGKKPTLADFDYDTDQYEKELTAWHDRKRAIEAEDAAKRHEQEAQERQWKERLDTHNKLKSEIAVNDFDDAEIAVQSSLSVTQQGIIIHGSKNSALLFYALGKNPARLQELAKISDPVRFAFAVADLEAKLKVSKGKTPPPPPERIASGASSGAALGSEQTLEKLREEAAKTGDYSKVHAFKRQQREKS